jgi:iron complex transport system substrate-binding protein
MRFAAALAAAITVSSACVAAPPTRVASLHLCADQLLLALADREQIASVTFMAAEPVASVMADAARGLPVNHGKAEEIVSLHPDLVLAGPFSARSTVALLRGLGARVVDLPYTTNFDDVRAQIGDVAALLGHPERGARLIAQMDARLAAVAPLRGARPTAVAYQPGGFTARAGSLEDAAIAAAGFDNLATRLDSGSGRVALETLVAAAPDLLILGGEADHLPSQQVRLLAHPALRGLRSARVYVPARVWTCGGWFTADAVALLAAQRAQ